MCGNSGQQCCISDVLFILYSEIEGFHPSEGIG